MLRGGVGGSMSLLGAACLRKLYRQPTANRQIKINPRQAGLFFLLIK